MCRLVLMNKEGEKEIDSQYGLENYFQYLEQQLGGHGNGFSLMKNGKVTIIEKGVNLDVRDIARYIKKSDYDWCLFHTRYASIGEKSDRNCHPFRRANFVMAMNGTESSVSFVSNIKKITDTEAILDLAQRYHLGLAALKKFNSIFMGFFNHKPYVVANNTRDIKVLKNDKTNAWVFASTFPIEMKENVYEVNECFTWTGSKIRNDILEKRKTRYFSGIKCRDLIYHNDLYDQCYWDFDEYNKGGNYAKI